MNLQICPKVLEKQSRTSSRSLGQYNKTSCKHKSPAAASEPSVRASSGISARAHVLAFGWLKLPQEQSFRIGASPNQADENARLLEVLRCLRLCQCRETTPASLHQSGQDDWRLQPEVADGHVVSFFLIKDVLWDHGSGIHTYAITRFNLYKEPLSGIMWQIK